MKFTTNILTNNNKSFDGEIIDSWTKDIKKGEIIINFAQTNTSSLNIEDIKINQLLTSDLKIKFSAKISNENDEKRILMYTLMMIILAFFLIKSNIEILKQINENITLAFNISLFGQCINIIWGTVYTILNMNVYSMSRNNSMLILPTFLFVINFGWLEVKLLTKIIEANNQSATPSEIKTITLKTFLILYSIMFVVMHFFTYFLINKIAISICLMFLWVPQIIHNIKINNRILFPLRYIITNSIVRLFFVFYIRGFSNNIFYFSTDKWILLYCGTTVFLQVVIIYSQSIISTTWFIPMYSINKPSYYTYSELKDRFKIYDMSCNICLSGISEYFEKNNDNENNSSILSNTTNLSASDNEIQENNDSTNFRENSESFSIMDNPFMIKYETRSSLIEGFLSILKNSFEKFHMYRFNTEKKDFFETNCKHVFHTTCIEKWIIQRKCPTCRAEITMD